MPETVLEGIEVPPSGRLALERQGAGDPKGTHQNVLVGTAPQCRRKGEPHSPALLLSPAGRLGPRVRGRVSERLRQCWSAVGAAVLVLGLPVLIVTVFSFPPPPAPQVTTYLHKDYNNLWIVKKHNVNSGNVAGSCCFLLLPPLSPP